MQFTSKKAEKYDQAVCPGRRNKYGFGLVISSLCLSVMVILITMQKTNVNYLLDNFDY